MCSSDLRAGAAGYVVKNSDMEELLLAIRSVYRGNTYFFTSVSEEISVNEVMLQAKQPEGGRAHGRDSRQYRYEPAQPRLLVELRG